MLSSVVGTVSLLASDGAGASPIVFSADLALFSLFVFLGLFFLLTKFAWKPLIAGLDAREQKIADQITAAHEANERAAATLRQYEQRLAAASDEANQILAQARQEAAAAKDRIVAEAAAEAQRQRSAAVADIQAAKNQALRELAERSVDSAIALAGNLAKKEIDRKTHAQLIRESLDRFVQAS